MRNFEKLLLSQLFSTFQPLMTKVFISFLVESKQIAACYKQTHDADAKRT